MEYSRRQERWEILGYTNEQIENHLRFERRKAKEVRERKKRNNKDNQELIKQIKNDLLGQTFEVGEKIIKVLSINPSVDGVGFWYKVSTIFSDESEGEFRYFYDFKGYSKKEFIKSLKYQ